MADYRPTLKELLFVWIQAYKGGDSARHILGNIMNYI
jgi:hypothetical protein